MITSFDNTDMLQKVFDFCDEYGLLDTKAIIVGVSGGPDSMALLSVLSELAKKHSPFPKLHCVHVNHNLRPGDCDREQQLVLSFCAKNNIPFKAYSFDCKQEAVKRGCSLELAGRLFRYEAFDDYARTVYPLEDTRIAVAHHKGDLSETMMMNLFRGCGLDGLVSLGAISGRIIRPLLELTKADLVDYLKSREIEYAIDSSNELSNCTRNVWRNDIFPKIDALNGKKSTDALFSTYELLSDDAQFINSVANEIYIGERELLDGYSFLPTSIIEYPKAILVRLIRRLWLESFGNLVDFERTNCDDVIELCAKAGKTQGRIDMPFARKCFVFEDFFGFSEKEELSQVACAFASKKGFVTSTESVDIQLKLDSSYSIEIPKSRYILDVQIIEKDCALEYNTKSWFYPIFDNIDETILTLHNCFSQGDSSFKRAGSTARAKLGKLFSDRKIPKEAREAILFISSGDEVLWLPGQGHSIGFTDENSRQRFFESETRAPTGFIVFSLK